MLLQLHQNPPVTLQMIVPGILIAIMAVIFLMYLAKNRDLQQCELWQDDEMQPLISPLQAALDRIRDLEAEIKINLFTISELNISIQFDKSRQKLEVEKCIKPLYQGQRFYDPKDHSSPTIWISARFNDWYMITIQGFERPVIMTVSEFNEKYSHYHLLPRLNRNLKFIQ